MTLGATLNMILNGVQVVLLAYLIFLESRRGR